MADPLRVAIIGHTGRGNYGHQLDRAFEGVAGATVVAVADPDAAGRDRVMAQANAPRGYADYREMLDRERPDIAVVATREIGDHLELVLAAVERGCHVYMEKPVAASPEQVDEMVAAAEPAGRLLVVAHPWRGHPPIQRVAIPLIKSGKIGEPRLARIYGMGGRHGGNELFLDLFPHFFDLLWQLFGTPLWCHAHITQDGRSSTPADVRPGAEGMGLVAGNGIKAYYAFEGGFAADFESYQGDGKEVPYRIDLHGTGGTLSLPGPMRNEPDVYFHPLVNPPLRGDDRWETIPTEPPDSEKWARAHHRMARAMVVMLRGEAPEYELVQAAQARLYLEMAMLAHASHMSGARAALPLPDCKNPFDSWT